MATRNAEHRLGRLANICAVAAAVATVVALGHGDEAVAPPTAAPAAAATAVAAPMAAAADLAGAAGAVLEVPAVPVGEMRVGERAPVQATAVAIGRMARALGVDSLLASCSASDLAFQPSIVDDRDALELLLTGRMEFALTSVQLSLSDRRAGLRDTLLGVELFAVVVAEESPLHGLTSDVVRRLLTGAITDRAELGLPPGPVVLGVPADPSVKVRAARAMITGDSFVAGATPVDGDRGAFDLLLRSPTALVVTHVAAFAHATGIRALEIDGVRPCYETFAFGTYRAGIPVVLATPGAPGRAAVAVAEVARSEGALAPDRIVPAQ